MPSHGHIELDRLLVCPEHDQYGSDTGFHQQSSQSQVSSQSHSPMTRPGLSPPLDMETGSPELSTDECHTSSPNTSYLSKFRCSRSTVLDPLYSPAFKKRPATTPWTLRRTSLSGFILFLAMLIIALEVLSSLSHRHQGLASSSHDAIFLWKYFPTAGKQRPKCGGFHNSGILKKNAILSIPAIYWSNLEYHTKALMAWKLISKEPRPTQKSLSIDYVSPNFVVSLWKSMRSCHVPVIAATLGSVAILLATVTSTGLFVPQSELISRNNTMSISSSFQGIELNLTTVDVFPALAVYTIMSGASILPYPPYTNQDYAVESFNVDSCPAGRKNCLESGFNDSSALITASVDAFSADLLCELGAISNMTINGSDSDSLSIYATLSDGRYTTAYTSSASTPTDNATTVSQIWGEIYPRQDIAHSDPRLFLVFLQLEISARQYVYEIPYGEGSTDISWNVTDFGCNATVVACTPSYAIQNALVTTDSEGTLLKAEIGKETRQLMINASDIWTGVYSSIQKMGPMVDSVASSPGSLDYHSDDFFHAMAVTRSGIPDYSDAEVLMHDARSLFRTVAIQVADRVLRYKTSRKIIGSRNVKQLRVVLQPKSLRFMEVGLGITIISSLLLMFIPPFSVGSFVNTDLAHLAILLGLGSRLGNHSGSCRSNAGQIMQDEPGEALYEQHNEPKNGLPAATKCVDDMKWWKPIALNHFMALIILALPILTVGALETTYHISHTKQGLGDLPADLAYHYLWTWLPALLMTITKLLYQSVTSSIAMLDPYAWLRKESVAAQQTLFSGNLSKTSLHLCYYGCKNKRWALLGSAFSALLAPFLTIAISGLFVAQSVPKTQNMDVQLADHITNPSNKQCNSSGWSQPSLWAANLLVQGYSGFPKGSHENFVYSLPSLSTGHPSLPVHAQLQNASSLQVEVPAVLSNVTCRVMDPAGFRWMTTTGEALNYTHPEFATLGFGNDSASPRCPSGVRSLMWGLMASPDRIAHVVYTGVPPGSYSMDIRPEFCADPSVWADNGALIKAIATRNKFNSVDPDLFIVYGAIGFNTTVKTINGLACYFSMLEGQAKVTYDLFADKVSSFEPILADFKELRNTSHCTPDGNTGLDNLLPGQAREYISAPGVDGYGVVPINSFWQAALNGSDAATYDAPENVTKLADQICRIYNDFYTQFFNNALRDRNPADGVVTAPGILTDDNRQRLFQDGTSTRILEALLLTMWLCTTIAYLLFNTKKLLPENPCSIAAQMSLLANSKFLDLIPAEAENATAAELMQMTPFKDHLFSLGWWDDDNGGRRFGIDVGMADFDKGDVEGEKEEGSRVETNEAEDGEGVRGKVDARISVDVVDSER